MSTIVLTFEVLDVGNAAAPLPDPPAGYGKRDLYVWLQPAGGDLHWRADPGATGVTGSATGGYVVPDGFLQELRLEDLTKVRLIRVGATNVPTLVSYCVDR